MKQQLIDHKAKQILSLLLQNKREATAHNSHCLGHVCQDCQAPHLAVVRQAIQTGQPLKLILPAFPAKSANRQKTISPLPDLGEIMGLTNLNALCQSIQAIHAPGVELLICSDGRVFNDLVLVSEEDVDQYQRGIQSIIAGNRLVHLTTFSLDEIYPDLEPASMREQLMAHYGESMAAFKQRLLQDPALRYQFNGIHRFIFEDQLVLRPNRSKNQIRLEAKPIAYDVIRRSNAWSRLLADRFPDSLRLSIHPQPCGSDKLGVQFLPAANRWATPWHNVLLKSPEGWQLIKRADAQRLGATFHQDHYVLEAC